MQFFKFPNQKRTNVGTRGKESYKKNKLSFLNWSRIDPLTPEGEITSA